MASTRPTPALLSASPASLHFSGFQLDRTYQQRVSVRNDSGKSLRLQFTFPGRNGGATAAFRVAFAGDASARKPFVSAGLTEELVVSFRAPRGFEYYYDCIRVRCEQVAYASNAAVTLAGELLVPLHAYPVANAVRDFPTRIDFGSVPVGQVARREIPLACSVPIEFEFAVELTKAHPSFTVFPLRGVVPANGIARVEIEFRPLTYSTASAELRLLVSQLGFEPVVCSIVGSSFSTAGSASVSSGESTEGGGGAPPSRMNRQNGGGANGRAGGSSSPSKSMSPKRSSGGSSRQAAGAKESAAKTEVVDGIEVPVDLNSVTSVAFVLNQQAGKLRPRDLKKAIAASRELRQKQEDLAASGDNNAGDRQVGALAFSALVRYELDNSKNNEQDPVECEAVGRMRFQREVKEVEALEKALEFQSHRQARLGAPLVSKEQTAALDAMRVMNAVVLARDAREKMRNEFDTVTSGLEDSAATKSRVKTATLPVEIAFGAAAMASPPDFKPHKNDMWARRARVLQRLVRAISTVIVRVRAQRRLDRLKRWLGRSATRANIRERVALDWEHSRRGNNQLEHEEGEDSRCSSGSDMQLYLPSVPEVERHEFRSRQRSPVATSDVGLELKRYAPPGFARFLPVRERDEALVMGHTPIALPPLSTYVPLFIVQDADSSKPPRRMDGHRPVRTLRVGAFDEYGCALRSLSVAPVSDSGALVASTMVRMSLLDLLPRDVFLRSQAAVRPLAITDRNASVSMLNMRMRESDAGFALRPLRGVKEPEARTFSERRALTVGMASVAAERRWRRQTEGDANEGEEVETSAPSLFPSDVWMPATTATTMGTAVDPLFWIGDSSLNSKSSLFNDVWHVGVGREGWGIPAFAASADNIAALSDSESDEDEDEADGEGESASVAAADDVKARRRRVPTWEDALHLFEPDGDTKRASAVGFERYTRLEQQEWDYCATRRELLDRLPSRLEPLAQQLAQIPGAPQLIVEGHGPQRPLHEPSERVTVQ